MKTTRILILLCSLVAVSNSSVFSQTIVWSPPDKSFSIEVPEKLEKDNDPGIGEASDPNAVSVFASAKKKPAVIIVVLKYASFATESTKEKFGGLFFLIGGDNDYEFIEKDMKVDGLPAREIVYKNKPNKGMFIDAGNTVYVLGLFGNERKDLDSAVARRFFDSFRLNRTPTKKNK